MAIKDAQLLGVREQIATQLDELANAMPAEAVDVPDDPSATEVDSQIPDNPELVTASGDTSRSLRSRRVAASVVMATFAVGIAVPSFNSIYNYYNPTEEQLKDPAELAATLPDFVVDALEPEAELPKSALDSYIPDPKPEATSDVTETKAESPFQPVEKSRITRMQIIGRESGVEIMGDFALDQGRWYTKPDGSRGVVLDPERNDIPYLFTQGVIDLGVEKVDQSSDSDESDSEFILEGDYLAVGDRSQRPIVIEGHAGLGIGIFGSLYKVQEDDVLYIQTENDGLFVYKATGRYEALKGSAGAEDPNNPLTEPKESPNYAYVVACIPDPAKGGRSETAAVYTFELVASIADDESLSGTASPSEVPKWVTATDTKIPNENTDFTELPEWMAGNTPEASNYNPAA